jgi:hypothetical protein
LTATSFRYRSTRPPSSAAYLGVRQRNGLWAEEDELGLNEPLEDHLAKLRQFSAMLQGQGEPDETLGLGEEIIRYHHRYRPHDTADVKYVWSDS